MPLVTLANYKTYAGVRGGGYDAAIQLHINQAEAMLRDHAGRSSENGFESATRTEVYDGHGAETIQLREWPVSSITLVEERGTESSWTTVAASEYRVNESTGLLYRLGARHGRVVADRLGGGWNAAFGVAPSWGSDPQNVRVTYVGGYATIPADIAGVVYLLVDFLFANAGSDMTAVSESIGVYSKSRGGTYMSADDILAKAATSKMRGLML
jgi:hypothetical protein